MNMQNTLLLLALILLWPWLGTAQAQRRIRFLIGGDVNWCLDFRGGPTIYYDRAGTYEENWRPTPYVATP